MTDFTLDEVTSKEPDQLNTSEKDFLTDQKDNLSDDQREKFGLGEEKKESKIDPEDWDVETREEKKLDDDDDDTDQEDKKVIDRRIQRRLSPLAKDLKKAKIQSELDGYLLDNPEHKKYKKVILKYKTTPNSVYADVPVHRIAKMVSYEDAEKQGAKREREIKEKVDKTKSGGRATRKGKTGKIDWQSMSNEEFEQKKAEMLGRG